MAFRVSVHTFSSAPMASCVVHAALCSVSRRSYAAARLLQEAQLSATKAARVSDRMQEHEIDEEVCLCCSRPCLFLSRCALCSKGESE